jgi:hypothetical protein
MNQNPANFASHTGITNEVSQAMHNVWRPKP